MIMNFNTFKRNKYFCTSWGFIKNNVSIPPIYKETHGGQWSILSYQCWGVMKHNECIHTQFLIMCCQQWDTWLTIMDGYAPLILFPCHFANMDCLKDQCLTRSKCLLSADNMKKDRGCLDINYVFYESEDVQFKIFYWFLSSKLM